ncbi:venom carboxylesterase-6-like isoform X2 [Vanessa tameamea]|uniref:Venom carboxylesterase-6-like isoform X2 n=1 Tax=Vanessa tameamea TaxID=334116 RepID=A0A8B8IG73_VANTA
MSCVNLLLFLSFAVLVTSQGPHPTVKIGNGALQGRWMVSTNGRKFASFNGIPYARPPLGKYRFREPQQMKPWSGVWDATRPLSSCLQYEPFLKTITGSEDCLFVNVHTPKLSPAALLPVLVFIHGGAFMYGTGSVYEASHLIDRDMVVVTFNYRLGPLGTFHRGIAFSGSALSSWTHSLKPAEKAKALAAIVGCPTGNSREMADCLKYRPGEVIVNAQIEMMDWKVHMFTPFTPSIEAPGTRDPFLSHYPYIASQSGYMRPVPLITSVTSEEGLYPAAAYQTDPSLLPDLESRWEYLAPNIFEYNDTLPLELRSTVANKIKQHYLGGKPVSQETFPQLVQALGDRLFVAHVGKLAQIHAQRSHQPTYLYHYTYRGQNSLSNLMANNDNNYGVSHADDVLAIFKCILSENNEDVNMRNKLIDVIYSYMTTGVPKIANGPEWLQVKPGATELNYLEIAGPNKIEMKTSSDFGQTKFWDSLGFLENEKFNANIKDEL